MTQGKLFTDRLYRNAQPIWNKNHQHPFVQGIGDGSLPIELFAYYMKQDYVYLIEYSKLFAIGTQKAKDLQTMQKFSHSLHSILHFEMDLHRKYAKEFGISEEELEQVKPTPINLAYTNYMVNVSLNGSLAEVVSCLLPCAWDYWEIGKLLKKQHHHQIKSNPYSHWIETYSSDEFGSVALWLIKLMNQLTEGTREHELVSLEKHFQMTSRFEYMFWDMVYHQEEWPL
ncbi:thiaminase II [Heyndrickxia sporothermodurans]|nr:thiaminase II [Heyndrickxia sporothermodurans]KYD08615.1 Thiaminase II [Heyndrickxia sporothermodurans]MEB6550674.1 thiaminase II [Heyndrickxia sporothermodurans]MED3652583.1 thiaminase II [Heyndrickxia sporothermodurans]MED3655729.1 thiaminase II [Heyndrickxia sporothermodurans]MED3698489.1 thiaminase II [Heyndrickxia sporothermodurans]